MQFARRPSDIGMSAGYGATLANKYLIPQTAREHTQADRSDVPRGALMHKTTRFLVSATAFVFISIFAGCNRSDSTITLQREWSANAEYAGDVWASEIAAANGRKLDVREGSQIIDPIKQVRSKAAQFGVASADRVLRENEGGAGLVILATAVYRSPVVFIVNPKNDIKSPAGFRGLTIGIQAGTNTELVFRMLVKLLRLPSDMKVVESGWGTKTFEDGTLDVLAGFDYDEPVLLTMKNVPHSLIYPEKSGVRFIGTVFFTSKALVNENPAVVQHFMDDLVSGWRQALENPNDAIIKLGARYKDVDTKKELISFQRGRPYFAGEGGRLLYASRERWEQMATQLTSLGILKSFNFGDHVDYRFLDAALSKSATGK